jgi:sulfur carrier protein ThiS
MEYLVDGLKREIKFEIKSKMKLNDFLREINENRESVIVKINDIIVTEFDYVSKGDKVELIKIASGG